MAGGRFVCVALPIILTIGAIISFMVATLSGIAHNSLYIFSVNLEDLSLDENAIEGIVGDLNLGDITGRHLHPDADLIPRQEDVATEVAALTAGGLALGSVYEVTLWGYCEVRRDGDDTTRECSDGEFNWASKHLRTEILDKLSFGGKQIELPEEIDSALDIFSHVIRYTEIAFIVALAVLGAELLIGIFSNFTRVISCLTWLIGIVALVISLVAAGMATATGAVVVGAVEATAEQYGVRGSLNTNFLACIWIGAAFAVAASLFWLFTICCCKPDHSSSRRRKNRDSDGEKLMPTGSYAPIGGAAHDHDGANSTYHNQFQPTYGQDYSHAPSYAPSYHTSGRSEAAYEPYSHRA